MRKDSENHWSTNVIDIFDRFVHGSLPDLTERLEVLLQGLLIDRLRQAPNENLSVGMGTLQLLVSSFARFLWFADQVLHDRCEFCRRSQKKSTFLVFIY